VTPPGPGIMVVDGSDLSTTPPGIPLLRNFAERCPASRFLDNVVEAYRLAEHLGFGRLVHVGAAMIVVLDPNPETLTSYTYGDLAGTIYTSPFEGRARLADAIIHEATHSALELYCAQNELVFQQEALYYSPWKGTQRPPLAFLHACLTFSVLASYYRSLSERRDDRVTQAEAAWGRRRLRDETGNILGTYRDLRRVLATSGDSTLENSVVDVVAVAVASG
jgi:HEXXH motif-containing protein